MSTTEIAKPKAERVVYLPDPIIPPTSQSVATLNQFIAVFLYFIDEGIDWFECIRVKWFRFDTFIYLSGQERKNHALLK